MAQASNHKETLVKNILTLEWTMFTAVQNIGGRASCQDDPETFLIMRGSQFLNWSLAAIESYYQDLQQAHKTGRNLMAEKYGYMMETTAPAEYEKIRASLPAISPEKQSLINKIVKQQLAWNDEMAVHYPNIIPKMRPIHKEQAGPYDTSCETYVQGELMTYSLTTLTLLWQHIEQLLGARRNLCEDILRDSIEIYGYQSIADV